MQSRIHRLFETYPAILTLILGVLAIHISAKPATGPVLTTTKPSIDSAKIRKLYLGGDFEEAIALLESSLKEKQTITRGDSVFIFKHLGVMYAATYETREKGKYYMHQLLLVEPTARILDMYASDMIYMIFKNIQEEFESNRMASQPGSKSNYAANQGDSGPKSGNTAEKKQLKSSQSNTWLWVGATTVAVGAGIAAYLVLGDEPSSSKQNQHTFPGK
jgi:hypothetical protein